MVSLVIDMKLQIRSMGYSGGGGEIGQSDEPLGQGAA